MTKPAEPVRGNPNTLFAMRQNLSTWATSAKRSRHDYDSDNHLLDEMMHTRYWGTIIDLIEPGDIIHITDGAGSQAEIRIDWKRDGEMTVGYSFIREIEEQPVLSNAGFSLKFRGNRGGYWCIVNAEGDVVEGNIIDKRDAMKRLDEIEIAAKKAA